MEKAFKSLGWNVVVITEEDDINSEYGQQKAINAIKRPGDVLWHSQPCTGGCPWQRVNMKRGGKTKDKILQHWSKFRKIWASFEIIAEHALNIGA